MAVDMACRNLHDGLAKPPLKLVHGCPGYMCNGITRITLDVIDYLFPNRSKKGHQLSENQAHCGLVTPYSDIGLGQHWLR